jgi:ferritin
MLSERLHVAINNQINAELWSAYLYLSMSMDAESKGYKGVANWFYVQWLEEQDHARILANYLNSRDAKVELKPIEEVRNEWESVQEMFRETLRHEKVVTGLINNLASIAAEDHDFASSNMLVWFINEQIEEEESAREMIFASESVENDKYGMYQLDKELSTRIYKQASPLAASAE